MVSHVGTLLAPEDLALLNRIATDLGVDASKLIGLNNDILVDQLDIQHDQLELIAAQSDLDADKIMLTVV